MCIHVYRAGGLALCSRCARREGFGRGKGREARERREREARERGEREREARETERENRLHSPLTLHAPPYTRPYRGGEVKWPSHAFFLRLEMPLP